MPTRERPRSGPLAGLRVVELGGRGPVPFAGMLLADAGATVLRVDAPAVVASGAEAELDWALYRGRWRVGIDLKHVDAPALVLELVTGADVLIEGFRPGVADRLGVGSDTCMRRNPGLVVGQSTGWGQAGPLAQAPGHDLSYLALSGLLAGLGRPAEVPAPPGTLIGDFASGGMLLAFGVVSAVFESQRTGRGQVVDAAILDGAAALGAMVLGMRQRGTWSMDRGDNVFDGGAPFYDVYPARDGRYVAIAANERPFYARLLDLLDLEDRHERDDPARWPELRRRIAAAIRARTRDEWAALPGSADACLTPVLTLDEATEHPHQRARQTFLRSSSGFEAGPAPRFSAVSERASDAVAAPGGHTRDGLRAWGIDGEKIERLLAAGCLCASAEVP